MSSDLLGPSGQPLGSNPFTSQGQAPAAVTVNTTGAQAALDQLLGSFKSNWEKAEKERLKAEENLYRSLGNLSRAHAASMTRQKDEYISKVKETTNIQIQEFEKEVAAGKRTTEELMNFKAKKTLETQNSIASAERDTLRKITEERKKSALTQFGGGISAVGQKIGGPIGGAVSSVGGFVSEIATPGGALLLALGALISVAVAKAERSAQTIRIGASFAQGGSGLNLGETAVAGRQANIFGGLGAAISARDQEKLIGVMASSPSLLNEATSSNKAFLNTVGLFANVMPDATEILKTMTFASHDLGLSSKELVGTFTSVRVNQHLLNMSFNDTLETQFAMQKSLRNITTDGGVAANVLTNMSGFLTKIGANPEEKARFAGSVAQGISNLSLSQIVGMAGFTNGGRLPTHEQLFGGDNPLVGSGTPALLGKFLSNVGAQAGPGGTLQSDLVADQLRQQFLPGLPMRGVGDFFQLTHDLQNGKITPQQYGDKFKEMEGSTPQALMAGGITKIANALGPMGELEVFLGNKFKDILDALNRLSGLPSVQNGMKAVGNAAFDSTGIPAAMSVAKKLAGVKHQ